MRNMHRDCKNKAFNPTTVRQRGLDIRKARTTDWMMRRDLLTHLKGRKKIIVIESVCEHE